MRGWFTSWFGGGGSEPAVTTTVRRFQTGEATITSDVVAAQDEGWLIDVHQPQVVRLFEIVTPDIEQCLLSYRAAMRSEELAGRAFLEMWCRFPGKGEFFSRGLRQVVQGTTGWSSYETPFRLKKGQRPDLIKLNVAVKGTGRIWVKDVELLMTPR